MVYDLDVHCLVYPVLQSEREAAEERQMLFKKCNPPGWGWDAALLCVTTQPLTRCGSFIAASLQLVSRRGFMWSYSPL